MSKLVEIRKGLYYDSVKLMLVSKAIAEVPGVTKASVVMGTELNKENLSRQDMDSPESQAACASDLIVSIKAENDEAIEKALQVMDEQLSAQTAGDDGRQYRPHTFGAAVKQQPGSNLAIVSVPGAYAAELADEALDEGLSVLLFSDNVSLEDERRLKEKAVGQGLLLMGPDCGTAVINGVPLCFANVVQGGPVGIVSASGTGSQEVMCLLDSFGVGITQNIGTGGRDLKEAIGGLTFLQALAALNEDPNTKVIALISKPPSEAITEKVLTYIRDAVKKPVVLNLIGAGARPGMGENVHFTDSLEECAVLAAGIARGCSEKAPWSDEQVAAAAAIVARQRGDGKLVRAYYSGGTLAYEAELLLGQELGQVVCNLSAPDSVDPVDPAASVVIDFGDDEYTVGRAHPMIDSTLRAEAFEEALADPATAVILLDFVLGYGASPRPHEDFVRILSSASRRVPVVANVVGTAADPQDKAAVVSELEAAGVIVAPSNRSMILVACEALR